MLDELLILCRIQNKVSAVGPCQIALYSDSTLQYVASVLCE